LTGRDQEGVRGLSKRIRHQRIKDTQGLFWQPSKKKKSSKGRKSGSIGRPASANGHQRFRMVQSTWRLDKKKKHEQAPKIAGCGEGQEKGSRPK